MLLMFESSIRGGLTQAVKQYSVANNTSTEGYDPEEPDSWIIYLDATNLYGWAMQQYLPKDGFKWSSVDLSVTNIRRTLEGMNEKSTVGMVLKVTVSYPPDLHDMHNDLQHVLEKKISPKGKFPKLLATLESKKNYVVHFMALKRALNAGLILEKVHRVIEFNQSDWMGDYIRLNTDIRKNAFEKSFFKLMNNSVFGKTMENVRNHMDMKLV